MRTYVRMHMPSLNILFEKAFTLFLLLFIAFSFVASAAEKPKQVTIGLIGDSTVADTYGWGPAFAKQCNDHTKVLNYAKNGATLKSLSDKLDELIAQKPDYILIQFGHNDMKQYDAKEYGVKLKDYIERIKKGGCKPIVLSSVTRRVFNDKGHIEPVVINGDRTLPVFAGSAQSVANESSVAFIDLNKISIAHHNKIGPTESAKYNFNKDDKTHFSPVGAQAIAGLIINELKKVVPELETHFK